MDGLQDSVNALEMHPNNLEQHHHSREASVHNIPFTEEEEAQPEVVWKGVASTGKLSSGQDEMVLAC